MHHLATFLVFCAAFALALYVPGAAQPRILLLVGAVCVSQGAAYLSEPHDR